MASQYGIVLMKSKSRKNVTTEVARCPFQDLLQLHMTSLANAAALSTRFNNTSCSCQRPNPIKRRRLSQEEKLLESPSNSTVDPGEGISIHVSTDEVWIHSEHWKRWGVMAVVVETPTTPNVS